MTDENQTVVGITVDKFDIPIKPKLAIMELMAIFQGLYNIAKKADKKKANELFKTYKFGAHVLDYMPDYDKRLAEKILKKANKKMEDLSNAD